MSKFPDVPDWLTDKVKYLAVMDDRANREQIHLNASGWVIAYYLGMDVSSKDADPFFSHPPPGEDGRLWHGTVNRTIVVGETLFMLRSCPAFPDFCRRMRERQFRPHFLEMLEAKTFFKAGYQIHPAPNPGVKGGDFDFVAIRDGETVNAEVTALTASDYSDATVLNALNQKRKQVPKTHPAIILCVIPESWLTLDNWNNRLQAVAEEFLRQTRTINYVVFVTERHIDIEGDAGALFIWRNAFPNKKPRFFLKDAGFLTSGKPVSEGFAAVESGGDAIAQLTASSYDSEFFRWVDHLVPKP